MSIWIKIYNLPSYRLDKENAIVIGNKVGEYLEVDLNTDGMGRAGPEVLGLKVNFENGFY